MHQAPRQLPSVLAFGSALLFASLLSGGAMLSAQGPAKTPSWLDQPLVNWNKPGAAIPKAPHKILPGDYIPECQPLFRKAATPEDRAVENAGWVLFGPLQTFSGTTLLMGQSGMDGMCRPLGFHLFVFVDGRFAGTLSPNPMNSREDGSLQPVELFRPYGIDASFSRYKDSDPLCCPSAISSVTFEVTRGASGPLVVPKSVHTQPTGQSN